MNTKEMLLEVRKEIERLQRVADLLEGSDSSPRTRKKRKPMSPEARAKIAAAQKKRWAKQKS
jgi:hypothetical protein